MNAIATDSSGYKLTTTNGGGNVTIISSAGKFIYPPFQLTGGAATATDRNGNQISVDSSGHFYDTLSSTTATLTVSQTTPPTSTTFTYTAPSGASAPYTMSYKYYTVATNFGISGITEYGKTAVYLVDRITLPDQTYYQFTYEATPSTPSSGACTPISGTYTTNCVTARIASVTLPTNGSISYTYPGSNNGVFSDGSASGLQRVLSDGASWTATWLYSRTLGTGAASSTTTTDPANNVTVEQFQGIYETQRSIYQGSASSSNLLKTVNSCYNGNTSNCPSTAITLPITQRNINTVLSGGQQSEHDDFWNTYGGPTETDDYDYGTAPHGALMKKVLATYAALGNITAFRQSVTVSDAKSNTSSQVNYNYDQTTPTTTTNTPQHVSVAAPWGNLTSTNVYSSASTYLTKSATFYDTGNFNTVTDVNNGVTTYNYAAGTASCGNSFPTSINEAISGLSTSATWNCTGGVQLTSVDENSQTITTTYNDPYFWRPASITDQIGAVRNYCFGYLSSGSCTLSPTQMETALTFNSNNSTVDILTTVDGLGRTRLSQTLQAPGLLNYDTVETDYDVIGRSSRVTLPYSGTRGQLNSSVAGITTTYDALDRPLSVQDGGGGTTSYFYGNAGSQNQDVYVTRNPAPTWDSENAKRRQFEYDGLGRLTSVCEVTAGTGSWLGGNCAQKTAQTGYWTTYAYRPTGEVLVITQDAQASQSNQQLRLFSYDWMGRLIGEAVPEIGSVGNGTASYVYDSDSTCGNSNGDLVKTVDAAGDIICSTYDALHRKLTTTYPSGVYSSVTPQKTFVYDSATVNGQTMAYAKGRLAEAYTCYSPCSTKLTDIGLSYTVRGETSDLYESTPNSSGFYYHAAQTYWANHGQDQLSGNLGLPTMTYGPDGEGRIKTVSASSGQNPVSGTTYNSAGLPTAINLGSGSGDADSYLYDPSTNRMTQYQFTVNNMSLTAALGWNANATLKTQNITDSFNSADTQNCSYGYDDMTRLTSANCGSAASQTFAYDPFGNIDKSGSPYSFVPTYSATTNRMTNIAGFTPTYDGNGNVLNDNYHSYAWDADGHAISIDAGMSDAVSLTYDALGRMVEQNRSGVFTQIAYSPVGQKLALMRGQTLQKAMLPLSGKDLAVYSSSGLLYYGHSDYLGTIRLGTTPSRNLSFDTAYAPFGETYASLGTIDPAYTGQTNDTSAYRQDSAGGLYDFPLREYSSQGRWPNPDPLGRAATCPKDPQSENRYAYVRNNPITYTDPTGGVALPPWIPGGGDIGGCDPDDPLCGDCSTNPALCPWVPIGVGVGGGSTGGSNPEHPRTFPWPLLPPGLFPALGSNPKPCTVKVLKPNQIYNGFNACADEGAQLIWGVECTGDYNCCIDSHRPYQQACETPPSKFHYNEDWVTQMLSLGLCCKK
jgi:RHS repeat-associated protein